MPHRMRLWAVTAVAIGLAACSTGAGPTASPDPATTSSTGAGTASSAPATPPPPDPVEVALAGLDRRQQVAQLFVVGVPLSDVAAGDALVQEGVGGVFLRGRSQAAVADLAAATSWWASTAPGPRPWVAADQEGGQVQALSGPGFAPLPPAIEQGGMPPAELAALADELGSSLSAAGVTLDLAPVVDVVPPGTESGNAPIGAFGRQFAGSPDEVVAAAGEIVRGMSAHGVTATLKHFPGLGNVRESTDTTAHVVDDVLTADDGQVAAFGTLARSPARPFVMLSSAVYARIDADAPATFSPVVVTDLLRGRLGFEGVVISDDLAAARAVQDVEVGERAVRFLAAGGTLVLTVDAATLPRMVEAVLARDAADPAFAQLIDRAVRTALEAKVHAGLLPR